MENLLFLGVPIIKHIRVYRILPSNILVSYNFKVVIIFSRRASVMRRSQISMFKDRK